MNYKTKGINLWCWILLDRLKAHKTSQSRNAIRFQDTFFGLSMVGQISEGPGSEPFGIIAPIDHQSHQCFTSTSSVNGTSVLIWNSCPISKLLSCFGLLILLATFQRLDFARTCSAVRTLVACKALSAWSPPAAVIASAVWAFRPKISKTLAAVHCAAGMPFLTAATKGGIAPAAAMMAMFSSRLATLHKALAAQYWDWALPWVSNATRGGTPPAAAMDSGLFTLLAARLDRTPAAFCLASSVVSAFSTLIAWEIFSLISSSGGTSKCWSLRCQPSHPSLSEGLFDLKKTSINAMKILDLDLGFRVFVGHFMSFLPIWHRWSRNIQKMIQYDPFMIWSNDPYTMCRHVQCSSVFHALLVLGPFWHFHRLTCGHCAMCLRKALDATKRNLSVLPGA